jgi:transposase
MNKYQWQQVNDLRDQGLSIRAIAYRLGLHRRTIRRALRTQRPPVRTSATRASIIDPHRGWLLARLQQYPELSVVRLCSQLKEHGYTGGYSTVKQCVAELRPRLKPAHLTLSFAPGECAQVDWGYWGGLDVPGGRRRVSYFVMVLCHSRMLYAELFMGEATEHWLRAHRNAFEHFGGTPARVMVDNCKTAIITPRCGGAPAELNPAYEEFAQHYGFRVDPCNVRRPNEKGRVENAVGYVRSGFLAGREPGSLAAVAPALADWLQNHANQRLHATTGRRPAELFAEAERVALRPLPAGPHECYQIQAVAADSRFRVTVETNRYSVPCSHASRRLTLHRYVDRIVVRDRSGALLADHPRCYGRKQDIADPEHERPLVLKLRHAHDQRRLERFLALGPDAAAYLDGLREKRPNWRTHVDRINALAEIHGPDALRRAMADARESAAFSAEYLHNLLDARNRFSPEPGPLHLTRRSDLLDLSLPEPDLNVYK